MRLGGVAIACCVLQSVAFAASPAKTEVLGAFVGFDAPLHPANEQPHRIAYEGTDLGWSYAHDGKIQFLFGDTHVNDKGEPISRTHDDSFGFIAIDEWPDPARITPANLPRIQLAQASGTSQALAMDPGQPMEGLKTPLAGFSNGKREFALFVTGKPQACRADAECTNGLTCDVSLGVLGARSDQPAGLTLPCADALPGCAVDTQFDEAGTPVKASGLCSDRTSTIWTQTDFGRIYAYGIRQLFAIRSDTDPSLYAVKAEWLTNKFINVAARSAGPSGKDRRVFLWGRPWFTGVNASGSTLGLYFAYVTMPEGPGFTWEPHYFTGVGADGVPRFSRNERDAIALDLDASRAGVQAQEAHDIVNQMSIVWMEQLRKWVMFYGGGISKFPIPQIAPECGVLEIFARTECQNVVIGNGAIRMRTADDPWGPWSPPQDVIAGGNPDQRPPADQYASGGVLHHPACVGEKCQPPSPYMLKGDYGWLYGANIIEEWIKPVGRSVDVIWIASTWDPYRVVLLRTRIDP